MREKELREIEGIGETIRQPSTPNMKAGYETQGAHFSGEETAFENPQKEDSRAAFLRGVLSAEFAPKDTQALHDTALDPPFQHRKLAAATRSHS